MSHIIIPHYINLAGALVGWLGIAIAMYFQLLSERDCPPKYVVGFLVFGVAMVLIHTGAYINTPIEAIWFRIIGYITLTLLQIGAAFRIYKSLSCEPPAEALKKSISLK